MDTIKINKENVRMVAHRGLSGIECENTNSAFVAAGNRSYFGIETDIHVTKDGKLIVYHDNTTERLADTDVFVEDTDYAVLKAIPLKNPRMEEFRDDYRMPDLREYIGICRKYNKVSVLELKNRMEKDVIQKVIDEIRKEDYLKNTIFISFNWDNVLTIREILPEQKVQYLVGTWDDSIYEKLEKYNIDLDIKYTEITKEITDNLHKMGREVNCWTCDIEKDAENLVKMGVDYITSNILE